MTFEFREIPATFRGISLRIWPTIPNNLIRSVKSLKNPLNFTTPAFVLETSQNSGMTSLEKCWKINLQLQNQLRYSRKRASQRAEHSALLDESNSAQNTKLTKEVTYSWASLQYIRKHGNSSAFQPCCRGPASDGGGCLCTCRSTIHTEGCHLALPLRTLEV